MVGVSGTAWAQPFTVLSLSEQHANGLRRVQYVVQNGNHPLNRFGVERIVLDLPSANLFTTPVILAPSLGASATSYTLGTAPGGADFGGSIAAKLARGALDLYLYSPRETFLAPGQCAHQADCAIAATWGLGSTLADLAFVRGLVADNHPQQKPVIGGYSLGGMVSLAAVNALPNVYAGLMFADSTLWITDSGLREGYQSICDQLNAAMAAGQVLDDQLNPLTQLIVQLAITAPDDPSPLPFFPAGTTNRQAYLGFFSAPQPGPPLSIFPMGFVLVAGSVSENRFAFASENRINSQVLHFNFYITNGTIRDVVCSFAGDPSFVSNLASYTGPLLSFQLGRGFGALANDVIALTGSSHSNIELRRQPAFGHVDLLATPLHALRFEAHILEWIYTNVIFHAAHSP
jgi:hypothetical protein